MTAIVGIQGKGWAVLGADTVTSYQDRPYMAKGCDKIVKVGEYLIAVAGDAIVGDILNNLWQPPKVIKTQDLEPSVHSWDYECLSIEYTSNRKTGKVRKYYPDFSVTYSDGHQEIIEIKQKRKLEQAVVIKKATAAREWCRQHGSTYRLITEIELKELGLS